MKKFLAVFSIFFALGIFMAATAEADNYAVIFSGGGDRYNNHDRYYEETLRMWNDMTGLLGYSIDKVYVLFADGTDAGIDRSSGVSSDWSSIVTAGGHISSATKSNLQGTIADLARIMTPNDSFNFWSFDHGSNPYDPAVQDEGLLVSWGTPWIRDDEFASWVNPLDVKGEVYAFAQCFAGDMVDDLGILPGENRFAAWAADWYESSYGQGWADAWADGLEAGLRTTWALGDYALYHDIYGPSGSGWEHPGWIGDDLDIITNNPVPEPCTLLLLGSGLVGLLVIRRRKLMKN
jgi:hypothetical protein